VGRRTHEERVGGGRGGVSGTQDIRNLRAWEGMEEGKGCETGTLTPAITAAAGEMCTFLKANLLRRRTELVMKAAAAAAMTERKQGCAARVTGGCVEGGRQRLDSPEHMKFVLHAGIMPVNSNVWIASLPNRIKRGYPGGCAT
jgi:hypothetical protein